MPKLPQNQSSSILEVDLEREKQDMACNFTISKNENPYCEKDLDVLIKNINSELLGVEIPRRKVEIYEAKLLNFVTITHPDNNENIPFEADVEIFCSKGTYIRSFALDLAKKLNTAAYLTSLVRTKAGNFDINNSIPIEEILPEKHAIKPHLALDLPYYELNIEEYEKVLNGVSFLPRSCEFKNTNLMLIFQNNLVSIGILSDNKIICKKVFK